MIWSAISAAGIEGNFFVALDGLRGDDFAGEDLKGDDFAGEDLSGEDADGEGLAREARFFRGVVMVAWLLHVKSATLGFVDASATWKIRQISNPETTRCHDVGACVARAQVVNQNNVIVLTTVRSAIFDVLHLSKNATSYHGDVINEQYMPCYRAA